MAKQLTGIITSTKMRQTVVVEIKRFIKHPKYHKIMSRKTVLKADSGGQNLTEGDRVRIEEIAPIAKGKAFKVVKKL